MSAEDTDALLWRAVLQTAIDDACGKATNITNPNARTRAQREAIEWLTTPSPDFDEVCALAGYEPDHVRAEAQRLMAAAPPRTRRGKAPCVVTYGGRSMSLHAWADELGISKAALRLRILNGTHPDLIFKRGAMQGQRLKKHQSNAKATKTAVNFDERPTMEHHTTPGGY